MDSITIKRGDTLEFICSYKEADTNTPINLQSFSMTVNFIDESDRTVIEINSTEPTASRYISTGSFDNGTFTVTFKDTEVLTDDVYYIDMKYTTASGFEQTSKAIKLYVKNKLV